MKKWMYTLLIILLCCVFLFCAYQLGSYYYQSYIQQQQFDQLAALVQENIPASTVPPTEPSPESEGAPPPAETQPPANTPLPEYVPLSQLNSDYAGWLQIEGTQINYPVMHAPDRTDYYLHRDFYGNYSGHGCLYIRETCDPVTPSDNVTIYGHNMKDGSMFAGLLNYHSKSYWQSHPFITFNTLTQYHTYQIFAVFTTTASRSSGFPYHQFENADTPEEFESYVNQCKALSLYDTGVEAVYGDKLITLSTCEYSQSNGRFVVVAKRIN